MARAEKQKMCEAVVQNAWENGYLQHEVDKAGKKWQEGTIGNHPL